MELKLNKVYRFDYTGADGKSHGRRTALFIDGNALACMKNYRYAIRFLDLEKGAHRQFIPCQMSNIEEVNATVSYVDGSKVDPKILDGIVKLHKDQGYTVFQDHPHATFVKDWAPKDITVFPTYDFGFNIKGKNAIGIYYNELTGKLETLQPAQYGSAWVKHTSNREALKAFRDQIDAYLKTV